MRAPGWPWRRWGVPTYRGGGCVAVAGFYGSENRKGGENCEKITIFTEDDRWR